MLFPETMLEAAADQAACRALLRNGSRTFYAAAHLLPRRVREPATALYAFCRLADDAVDLAVSPPPCGEGLGVGVATALHRGEMGGIVQAERTPIPGPSPQGGREIVGVKRAALERLKFRLDRAYAGTPLPLPADRAFAAAVADFAIPRELPEALLEGLAWDAEGRRYETLADLQTYAARVAGSVGAMMALVMGVRDPDALARACALGAAMQLTNIARDVGEDAQAGRLYLPLTWMREAGLDPAAWLAAPHFTPAIGDLVARLLAEAERYYDASEIGIVALPSSCRASIRAARLLYREIGREVARRGHDSVGARARVTARRKLSLVAEAVIPWRRSDADRRTMPDLSAARFLLACVSPWPARNRRESVADQVLWVLELFKRVEQRRRLFGST